MAVTKNFFLLTSRRRHTVLAVCDVSKMIQDTTITASDFGTICMEERKSDDSGVFCIAQSSGSPRRGRVEGRGTHSGEGERRRRAASREGTQREGSGLFMCFLRAPQACGGTWGRERTGAK